MGSTTKTTKTRADFKPGVPESLREIIALQLIDDAIDQGKAEAITDATIDGLMRRVYEKIEREALAAYKSNEPWALRQWALNNILKEEVVNEAAVTIATELVSPVVDWQAEQEFDPIGHFRECLDAERKSEATKRVYMATATRFVSMIGRKREYTDDEVAKYQMWVNKKYPNQVSYHEACQRLLQFLRRLPGADKQRKMPLGMPKMPGPEECYQPTLTDQDIESLIWTTALDSVRPDMVVRLAIATIYGARAGELLALSNDDFHLDGDKSTVTIRTLKRGQRKPQPIPASLLPLFDVPISPMLDRTMYQALKRVCEQAEVNLPERAGYHAIRRRVVTAISNVEKSDISVSDFMRWAKPRGMLARYRQTDPVETDREILAKHPYVKVWEQVADVIRVVNPYYERIASAPRNDNV